MTLTQIKAQKFVLAKALKDGNIRNKHGITGKIKQLQQRIREKERFNNYQNWLSQ